MARDAVGILPGVWFQITTKPDGFYAAVAEEGCDMRSSGYAMAMWVLGEMLAFGGGIRIAREAKFGRSVAGTAACLVGVTLAVPLVGAAAEALRA